MVSEPTQAARCVLPAAATTVADRVARQQSHAGNAGSRAASAAPSRANSFAGGTLSRGPSRTCNAAGEYPPR